MSNTLRNLGLAALLMVSASAFMPGQASALSMSECSAKYKAAKAADPNTLKWNDFRKAQCSTDASAAAPAAPAANAPATTAKTTTAATATTASTAGGGTFMQNCSASWKAMKAAGTTNGMSWKDFLAAKCQVASAPAATAPTPSGSFMKDCSASWKAMKAAGTTNGMSWKDFLAAKCQVAGAAPAPAAPAAPATMGKTKTTTAIIPPEPSDTPDATPVATADKNGKPYTPGQIAAHKRIRACADQWRQLKATNKLPANIAALDTKHRWPQYWSMCNKQLKAQGQ